MNIASSVHFEGSRGTGEERPAPPSDCAALGPTAGSHLRCARAASLPRAQGRWRAAWDSLFDPSRQAARPARFSRRSRALKSRSIRSMRKQRPRGMPRRPHARPGPSAWLRTVTDCHRPDPLSLPPCAVRRPAPFCAASARPQSGRRTRKCKSWRRCQMSTVIPRFV
jgi:hypothetical protein